MTDYTPTPIVVFATPTQPQIEAAIRQVILVVAPLLAAYGLTSAASALNRFLSFAGIAATIIVFVIGQLHTRSQAMKAAAMANKLPDTVATTK